VADINLHVLAGTGQQHPVMAEGDGPYLLTRIENIINKL
jgi:hypothetical protein